MIGDRHPEFLPSWPGGPVSTLDQEEGIQILNPQGLNLRVRKQKGNLCAAPT